MYICSVRRGAGVSYFFFSCRGCVAAVRAAGTRCLCIAYRRDLSSIRLLVCIGLGMFCLSSSAPRCRSVENESVVNRNIHVNERQRIAQKSVLLSIQ